MGAAFFYHLTQNPLEVTLPLLLEKARGAGWTVLVRGTEAAHIDWLDEKLWTGRDDAFLAHGRAGGPHDAMQPILLSTDPGNPNNAPCIMGVDGAEITAEEVNASERVCILFDGQNDEAMDRARRQWKALTDAGCAAQYWSEETGRWQKKRDTAEA
ncbi:DNA polymerase III subunit chi [Cognatishimia sp.]|uniref:DNA polymerase III subunit chi n=1 Tax=Cognatishimia sp. TaxID=2211648 RepID=UPI0035198FA3